VLIRVLFTTLVFAIIFIISSGLRIVKEWYGAEEQAKDIRHEQTVTELSLLRAQVNPHFLFNTLNNIYSLSLRKSDDAPQAVMRLADIMRYVLSDAQSEHVPLDKDLSALSEYIELQELRLTDKVTIDYTLSGRTEGYEIAPLILMTFVENAFKYGVSTHESSLIEIRISMDQHNLTALVINKLLPQAHLMERATGTGLANVRRRLELLYPDRHTLTIDPNDDGHYKVSLYINLA
jgi:LytS/YehU family sensor histidine kinase